MAVSRAKRADIADRRAKLIKYRLAGRAYDDIYEELGYSSAHAASRDFSRALESNIAEQRTSMEVYREAELMKLDDLTTKAMNVLLTRHFVTTQAGKIVEHPETGQPLLDDGPVLHAIDRLLKIGDRRAKLLGLDAPQRLEVLSIDAIDDQIRGLTEQLAALDGEAATLAAAEDTAG
jgi:hypothetical protein